MKSLDIMSNMQQFNSNLIVWNDKRNQLNKCACYQYLKDEVITVFLENQYKRFLNI